MENTIVFDISKGLYSLCVFALICIGLLRLVRHAQRDQSSENKTEKEEQT